MDDYAAWLTEERLKVEEAAWARVNSEGLGHRVFSDAVNALHPKSVIEFGCGTGWTAERISAQHYKGVDANMGCLSIASRRVARGEFVHCDFRKYEDKGKYDVSCAFAFLKHFALHEWDNIFERLLGFGKRSVFTMSICDIDKDNGTQFHHVYVDECHLDASVQMAGHEIVGHKTITNDEHGEERLYTTRRIDA